MNDSSDEELDLTNLVADLGRGGLQGEQAATTLYQDFWPKLFRHFILHRLPEADAEELANQVLLKAICNIRQLSVPAALRGWIWKIAANELASHWRANMAHIQNEIVSAEDDDWLELLPDPNTADPVLMRCLEQQLTAFSLEQPERAAALELALLEDLSQVEIANALSRTVHATTEFLHQCRKKLAHYLSHCLE